MTPRNLSFVLTADDFNEASVIVNQLQSGAADGLDRLSSLGAGRLTLEIAQFEVNDRIELPFPGGVLDWVIVKGESCVPRRTAGN